MTDSKTGIVKFFNDDRGYGFIKPDDGGEDVFVHVTQLQRSGLDSLNVDQKVSFVIRPSQKGTMAVDIRLAA
jgi:CspA family cold shock protein